MDLKKKSKKNLKPKREINKYRMQEEEEDSSTRLKPCCLGRGPWDWVKCKTPPPPQWAGVAWERRRNGRRRLGRRQREEARTRSAPPSPAADAGCAVVGAVGTRQASGPSSGRRRHRTRHPSCPFGRPCPSSCIGAVAGSSKYCPAMGRKSGPAGGGGAQHHRTRRCQMQCTPNRCRLINEHNNVHRKRSKEVSKKVRGKRMQ